MLLDTAAYVDLQRARKHSGEMWAFNTFRHASSYARHHGKPILAMATVMEIVVGFGGELGHEKLDTFRQKILPSFRIIGLDLQSACIAGEIYAKLERARQRIGVIDTVIAAIALAHELTLVTSNQRHFSRIVDLGYPLQIVNWREE